MLDKGLTVFIYLWVGFMVLCAAVDIASIVLTAPSIWSGIWAAQEKWFDPFNVVHTTAEDCPTRDRRILLARETARPTTRGVTTLD